MIITRLVAVLVLGLGISSSFAASASRTPPKDDKKPPEKPADKPTTQPTADGKVKVTAGDVSYVVLKSAVGADGLKWTVALEATSQTSDHQIYIQECRAVAPDGKTIEIKYPMGRSVKSVSLPKGTKIQIELKMGDLPKDVKSVARLELFGNRVNGIPGFETAKPRLGEKTEKVRPLVIENVPVERAEK